MYISDCRLRYEVEDECYFCCTKLEKSKIHYTRCWGRLTFCPYCGVFYLTRVASVNWGQPKDRHERQRISQLLAENKMRGQKGVAFFEPPEYGERTSSLGNPVVKSYEFTVMTVDQLLETYPTEEEMQNRVLQTLKTMITGSSWGEKIISNQEYAWAFCQDQLKFRKILKFLEVQKYITYTETNDSISINIGENWNMSSETSKNNTTSITSNNSVVTVVTDSQNANVNVTLSNDQQSLLKMIQDLREKCESLEDEEQKSMANAALDVLEAETPKPTPIIGKIKNACRLLQAKVTDKIVKTLVQQLVDKAVAIFKFSLF